VPLLADFVDDIRRAAAYDIYDAVCRYALLLQITRFIIDEMELERAA